MGLGRLVAGLVVGGLAVSALAQEYRIGEPAQPSSMPAYLTRPVEGVVAVTNFPEIQDVRILEGGTLQGPVEVQGEVQIRVPEESLLPVEVVNAPPFPESFRIEGDVRLDDEQPVRVWVENFPAPSPPSLAGPGRPQFAAFAFRGAFSSKEQVHRRTFRLPEGMTFHLTDLALDARPDALLRVRLTAVPSRIDGAVSVVGEGPEEIPLAVLDAARATTVRLGTAAALSGEFSLVVEAPGPGQGAPFSVVASGSLEPTARSR